MTRVFLAPAVALLIALGVGAPKPAQAADGEAIIGVIAGVAAVALIAKAIEDERDEEKAKSKRATNIYQGPRTTRIYRHDDDRAFHRGHSGTRIHRFNHSSRIYNAGRVLPDRCLRLIETRGGTRRAFGQRCLQRNGVNLARLPNDCAFRLRTDRGTRTFFGGRCLRQRGWLRQSVALNR